MIEISVWKILLVLVIAFIVLGPEQLPKVARGVGRLLGQLKGTANSIKKELDQVSAEEKSDLSSKDNQQE